jgi:hypothetical protein
LPFVAIDDAAEWCPDGQFEQEEESYADLSLVITYGGSSSHT